MAALGSPINPSNSIQMYERLKKESKSDYNRNYDTLQNAQIVENSKEKSKCSKIMNHSKKETDESVPYERLNSKPSQCQNVYDTLQNKEKGEYFTQQSSMSKACGKIGQNDIKVKEIPGYETLNSTREQDKSYDILKKSQIGDNSQPRSVESKERRQGEPILEINAIGTFHASQKSEHSYCSPLYDMENIDLEQERSYAYASFPRKTQNKKDKKDKTAKYQTCKHIASFLLGIIFGGVIFAIIVFAVLRKKIQDDDSGYSISPGNGTGNNLSCVWAPWTQWSDCSVLCGNDTQHRTRENTGVPVGCLPRTENQTKSCNLGVAGCQAPAPAFDMHFDPATLNSRGFLSTDNSILSNRYSSKTRKRSSGGDKSLQKYSGVIANRCFGGKKKVWFKVAYKYTIYHVLSFTNLILEIGVADRSEIDKDFFVGNVQRNGWSFALARCGDDNDNICLRSKHMENLQDNIFFSRNNVGLQKNGTFVLVVDRQNNTFQLHDLGAPYSNISFANVVSGKELCPVFGVYHSNLLDVQIQILDSKDVTNS
ncbi:uncharacterized protein [Mytilus edulis]|uniref:uncharacterized protein isoform X1 n=1 Tax=Mytilus edulis TaxID=6550 RepID=UPI0039EFB9D7